MRSSPFDVTGNVPEAIKQQDFDIIEEKGIKACPTIPENGGLKLSNFEPNPAPICQNVVIASLNIENDKKDMLCDTFDTNYPDVSTIPCTSVTAMSNSAASSCTLMSKASLTGTLNSENVGSESSELNSSMSSSNTTFFVKGGLISAVSTDDTCDNDEIGHGNQDAYHGDATNQIGKNNILVNKGMFSLILKLHDCKV